MPVLLLALGAPATRAEADVDYNRDIRPILSDNCYNCHGPDEGTRMARLRLDTREGALAELRGGRRAIVPGDGDASMLIQRVSLPADDYDVMPPAETNKRLTPEQVDLLRRWIDDGAPYTPHWAYVPPDAPAAPDVDDDDGFVRNPIDRFALATLREKGFDPSPEADRRTLLRRLSFDLTGLPPTPEEVDAFINDPSPDAYERQVERLLASPHYGERMAVYWLDLVRYADTTGIHGDNHREVSAFRDYVIDAFNHNKPYDWFTIEQLAGDLLPDPRTDQLIASGYNRLLMTTQEGGAQPKEYTVKYAADRVRNASTVWLGATLGCAECHDHKFDPYTMRDFYSFAAFFADVDEVAVGPQEPTLRLPTGEQRAELQRLDGRIAAVQRLLDTPTPELAAAQEEWERQVTERADLWVVLEPAVHVSEGGATLTRLPDGSILAEGSHPETDRYFVTAYTGLSEITAIRLELLTHESLRREGPGRSGNAVVSEVVVHAAPADDPAALTRVRLQNASASFSQNRYDVANAIDGNRRTGWAVHPRIGEPHHAVFETVTDLGFPSGTVLTVLLDQQHGQGLTLGRFRLSVTTAPRPVHAEGAEGIPAGILAILDIARDARTPDQQAQLAAYYRTVAPALAPHRERLTQLRARREQVEAGVRTMLVSKSVEPRVTRILPRGDWLDDSGEIVEPAVPHFMAPVRGNGNDDRATRLDLANWLVAPENPLTARVFVNRLWLLFFGEGIVRTPDDFGSQGAWPTHPDLLDWLADAFLDSGWDVKHMVRLMVTSGAYRQSSASNDTLRERDPLNRWLARQSRFRLDAELVRDNALAISGLLVPEIGGPSVKPYQPAGYWAHLNFPKREYQRDTGEALYRRGLYTYWCRTFLHPSLLAFDAPTREECTVMRVRSNTPLQALALLNDPTYVEAARAFAVRILQDGGDDAADRIAYAFRVALSREPTEQERAELMELCARHAAMYEQNEDAAKELLKVGEYEPPADVAPVELAAWTSVARVVLNLHETVTRY